MFLEGFIEEPLSILEGFGSEEQHFQGFILEDKGLLGMFFRM
jgi:hypothetical protein